MLSFYSVRNSYQPNASWDNFIKEKKSQSSWHRNKAPVIFINVDKQNKNQPFTAVAKPVSPPIVHLVVRMFCV